MTNLRAAICALVVALLVIGWGGASLAALRGTASDWAAKADAAPIRLLALIVLLVSVGLAFVPDREIQA